MFYGDRIISGLISKNSFVYLFKWIVICKWQCSRRRCSRCYFSVQIDDDVQIVTLFSNGLSPIVKHINQVYIHSAISHHISQNIPQDNREKQCFTWSVKRLTIVRFHCCCHIIAQYISKPTSHTHHMYFIVCKQNAISFIDHPTFGFVIFTAPRSVLCAAIQTVKFKCSSIIVAFQWKSNWKRYKLPQTVVQPGHETIVTDDLILSGPMFVN